MSHEKKTREQLRQELTEIQYHVTQEKGTEAPHTGEYTNQTEDGIYHCVCCGAELFTSDNKYRTSCGWPSFHSTANRQGVTEHEDVTHGMVRQEIVCTTCEAHLGHVFLDGPQPSGTRYCVNSASLQFKNSNQK